MISRRGILSAGLAATGIRSNLSKGKFLIVVHLYVGNMLSAKIKPFIQKFEEKVCLAKPDYFSFLLIPQLDDKTYVRVFSLDGEQWHEITNEKFSLDNLAEIESEIYESEHDDDQEVLDFCKLSLGYPLVYIIYTDEEIRHWIKIGRKYKVCNLIDFVCDAIQ